MAGHVLSFLTRLQHMGISMFFSTYMKRNRRGLAHKTLWMTLFDMVTCMWLSFFPESLGGVQC
jgi:hypothetical protein